MRIEDIYFEESVKERKIDKGTSQHSDDKIRVRDSRVISNMLNLMQTRIPFFRRE